MSILLVILTALVTDTARTDLTLSGHFGQGTELYDGTQIGGFSGEAQSIYDIASWSRIFGEAWYH